MNKLKALKLLHLMKETHQIAVQIEGRLYTAEDLMEVIKGRTVSYNEAVTFLIS